MYGAVQSQRVLLSALKACIALRVLLGVSHIRVEVEKPVLVLGRLHQVLLVLRSDAR